MYKNATAETHLEVWVNCPHCNEYQDVTDDTREHLGDDLQADHEEIDVVCDNKECKKLFTINRITY